MYLTNAFCKREPVGLKWIFVSTFLRSAVIRTVLMKSILRLRRFYTKPVESADPCYRTPYLLFCRFNTMSVRGSGVVNIFSTFFVYEKKIPFQVFFSESKTFLLRRLDNTPAFGGPKPPV